MEPEMGLDPASIRFLDRERLTQLPPTAVEPAFLRVSNALVEHRRSVRSAEWPKVLENSASLLGTGYAYLGLLTREAGSEAQRSRAFVAAGEQLNRIFDAIAKSDSRDQFVADTRETLSANDPDLLNRVDDALGKLEQGETLFLQINNSINNGSNGNSGTVAGPPADLAIAALSRGLQGLAHYYFNVCFDTFDPRSSIEHVDRVQATFSDLLGSTRAILRSAQSHLFYSALNDPNGIIDSSFRLARVVEENLPPFVAAQARFLRVAHALREAGKGRASEEAGALLASAGLLSREAFASQAAAYRLTFETGSAQSSRGTPLLDRVGSVAFDTEIPDGRNTELSRLGGMDDGTFVEISGFADSFQQARGPDGKLISQVELTDPSSGAKAKAAAVFVHLPHTGVTEGASINVNGVYRSSSDLLGGESGVECDVLSLSELASKSWRIQLLLYASPWIEVWRNGLNISWSIGPHDFAEDDSEEAKRGAAELVFAPFVR